MNTKIASKSPPRSKRVCVVDVEADLTYCRDDACDYRDKPGAEVTCASCIGAWYREKVAAVEAERDQAHAALRELVRLKAIKDDLTLTEIDDPQVRDYERSKPAAWAEARRIVG
jgi:hypothetical protein